MKTRILTVDDSRAVRMIVAQAFDRFDCQIVEAANGVEALAAASRERPDLIILDLTMPVMDGAETLAKLQSDYLLKGIPVIMLTAEAGRDNVLRIARMGVRDYLVKPFHANTLVERAGRLVELNPKNQGLARAKRFDDPIQLFVVDDKPAILAQFRAGLAHTTWKVEGRAHSGEAADYCAVSTPDTIIVSLSLPEGSGFALFPMLRASPRLKNIPIFGLSVKTAVDEQTRASQAGFAGIITKPLDFDDLQGKVSRALHLDTSYKYYRIQDGVLLLTLPANFNRHASSEISAHLRGKVTEAVDAGVDKLVIDLNALKCNDINVIRLCLSVIEICQELSLKQRIIASEAHQLEGRIYDETKSWRYAGSFEEALASLQEPVLSVR
jgi:two-component system cell cycle response regulator